MIIETPDARTRELLAQFGVTRTLIADFVKTADGYRLDFTF
jgi:deoxyribose-phosphate aldolase